MGRFSVYSSVRITSASLLPLLWTSSLKNLSTAPTAHLGNGPRRPCGLPAGVRASAWRRRQSRARTDLRRPCRSCRRADHPCREPRSRTAQPWAMISSNPGMPVKRPGKGSRHQRRHALLEDPGSTVDPGYDGARAVRRFGWGQDCGNAHCRAPFGKVVVYWMRHACAPFGSSAPVSGLERSHEVGHKLLLRTELGVDLLSGLLLEGSDDLPDRLILLVVLCPLPPHHEIGAPRSERRHDDRRGKNDGSTAHC
jgi:hypothetical protein